MGDEDETVCCNLTWTRLTKSSFETSEDILVDNDITLSYKDIDIPNRWNHRADYLFNSIGFAIGLTNVYLFPMRVWSNGGIVFIILHLLFSLCITLPILFLEIAIAQFTSLGNTQVFMCVPILYGIGWTHVILSFIYAMMYAVVIAWVFSYLFRSFEPVLPWSSCNNSFNTENCIPISYTSEFINNATSKMSNDEFFFYYVLGIESNSTSHHNLNSSSKWISMINLFIVWAISFYFVLGGIRVKSKLLYFTVTVSYVVLSMLFILLFALPGNSVGLSFYLSPNITKLIEPDTYFHAIEQSVLSNGICFGGHLTLAKHNNFHDNFYRDAIIIYITDIFTSYIAGFSLFGLIGYVAHKNKIDVQKIIGTGRKLYLNSYPQLLSNLPLARIWSILFFIMSICLFTDAVVVFLTTTETAITEIVPELIPKRYIQIITLLVISVIGIGIGSLLHSIEGMRVIALTSSEVALYAFPVIGILECISVGIIYGQRNFRRDLKMMTGFELHISFFITITYICPVVLSLFLMSKIIASIVVDSDENYVRTFDLTITYVLISIILMPVILCALHIILRRVMKCDTANEPLLTKLLDPPIYYGPMYKIHWLYHKSYRDMISKYHRKPIFLDHTKSDDDVKKIYKAVKKIEALEEISTIRNMRKPAHTSLKNKRSQKKK